MSEQDKIQLFENQTIRTAWDAEQEEWYFSVVDVVHALTDSTDPKQYIKKMGLEEKMEQSVHIPWATGGSLVPQAIREEYMNTHLK